jgi:hypothetical protein
MDQIKLGAPVLYQGSAAIVTAINADGSVNLRVFHPDGTDTSPAGVTLDVATAAAEPAVITDTAAADAAAV